MPPRNRSSKATSPAVREDDEELEDSPAPVRHLSTVDLDLDAAIAEEEAKHADGPPTFSFTLGGRDWVVERPGVGATLDAEQAVFLSDFFEIVMGADLWDEFEPVFREVAVPSATWKLARGISQAFGMDPASMEKAIEEEERSEGNRADRRARGRGRGRPAPRRR